MKVIHTHTHTGATGVSLAWTFRNQEEEGFLRSRCSIFKDVENERHDTPTISFRDSVAKRLSNWESLLVTLIVYTRSVNIEESFSASYETEFPDRTEKRKTFGDLSVHAGKSRLVPCSLVSLIPCSTILSRSFLFFVDSLIRGFLGYGGRFSRFVR